MPQIVPAGSINLTALQDPDLYIQVLQPPSFIRGVPTDVIGVVGTASWGPKNTPVHLGSGQDAELAFGPMSAASLLDTHDLATDLYLAFGQSQSNATMEGWGVRVTDGTDTAASVAITGAATATSATATVSGTITAGDVCTLTATSAGYTGSPQTVTYTVLSTDTLNSIAAALAAAVNANAVLFAAGVYASATGAVVTLYNSAAMSPTITWTRNVTGAATEVITIGSGAASTAGGTLTAIYTGTLGAQVRMTVATSPNVANAVNVTVSGFAGVAEYYPNIPTANFWRNLERALANGVANFRGPSKWARLLSVNAAVGAPTPATYTCAGGLDGRSVSTANMLGSSSAVPRTGVWTLTGVDPGAVIVWVAGLTDPTAAATMDSFALTDGCTVLFPLATGVTTTQAMAAIQSNGVAGPEFIYVKDSVYFFDPINNMTRLVLPTPVIGGTWATFSPEQSPLNKRVALVTGTERTDPLLGSVAYTPSEIGQLSSAGVLFVTNPCPGGSYFGIRTGGSTSPSPATAPAEYWRMTMFIARSLDAFLGIFLGRLQSQQANDDLRSEVKHVLNGFAETLVDANQIDSGVGFCEFSAAPSARFGNGINTPASVAQHYLYSLFKATYLSSVWFFVCSIQGGTTVVTIQPGQA